MLIIPHILLSHSYLLGRKLYFPSSVPILIHQLLGDRTPQTTFILCTENFPTPMIEIRTTIPVYPSTPSPRPGNVSRIDHHLDELLPNSNIFLYPAPFSNTHRLQIAGRCLSTSTHDCTTLAHVKWFERSDPETLRLCACDGSHSGAPLQGTRQGTGGTAVFVLDIVFHEAGTNQRLRFVIFTGGSLHWSYSCMNSSGRRDGRRRIPIGSRRPNRSDPTGTAINYRFECGQCTPSWRWLIRADRNSAQQ